MTEQALYFYDIQDIEYKQKCFECIDEINNKEEYIEIINKFFDELYFGKEKNIRQVWKVKSMSEIFGEIKNPFITNIMLLAGFEIHQNNMEKFSLDDEQRTIHIKRVRECLLNDIIIRKYDGIRISQMLWGVYFVNIRLIEVGRLQYEYIMFNPLDEKEEKHCIQVHIPRGEKLDVLKVKESLSKSIVEIKKYFGLDNPQYFCTSWLLSPQINTLVDSNSNIAKFNELFEIVGQKDGIKDVLNFVFNISECSDYNELEEKTTLQVKIKQMLLNNESISTGIGILK